MPNDTPTFASFNPTGDERVAFIKSRTDELIEFIKADQLANLNSGEKWRRGSEAITNYEQAAMWAVKSLFS